MIRLLATLGVVVALAPPLTAGSGPLTRISHRDKLYDVVAIGQRVLVVGYPGLLLRSDDGGKSWATQDLGTHDALFAIAVNPSGRGLIVGRGGLILATSDGGGTWRRVETAVSPKGASTGVEDTADEGAEGDEEEEAEEDEEGTRALAAHLFDVTLVGDQAWAVGHFGTVLHSGDAGATWARQGYQSAFPEDTPPEARGVISVAEQENEGAADEARLNAVVFAPDGRRGWIAGEFGMVLHTEDGGGSWQRQPSASGKLLFALQLVGEDHLLAVGAEGTCMETRDGGRHWQLVQTGVKEHLLGIFLRGDEITLVGQNGLVLVRRGHEEAFKRLPTGLYTWLNALVFLDEARGLAVGGRGHVIATDDAGAHWQRLSGR